MNETTEFSGAFSFHEGLPEFHERRVRRVLYVGANGTEDVLLPALQGAGWQIVRKCEPVVNGTKCSRCVVGILHLVERNDAAVLQQWKDLARACDLRWIALIPRNLLDDAWLCELFANRFYDYHTLPADTERLLVTLGRTEGLKRLEERARANRSTTPAEWGIVGSSRPVLHLLRDLKKVARTSAPVLITGESGTGKELAAAAVHAASTRANGPFIPVNCASLPANLIQSELFGHEKGSFTGAHRKSVGRIEAAAGGTIFLDEIGDLPIDLQTSLLRFLQDKTIERVGAAKPALVDVRVIAATNVDLERAVKEGRFRRDLFYRLNVFRLDVPALRARKEDIEPLAQFFFDTFSADKNPKVKGLSSSALAVMREYDWPGNVRELFNRLRQAMVMSENTLISVADLGLTPGAHREVSVIRLEAARAAAERHAIAEALLRSANNVSEAAVRLGITRSTMYRLLDKHGFKESQSPPHSAGD